MGVLLTRGPAAAALPADLFEEGNWRACRTECVRALAAQPQDPSTRLLKATAELRLGMDAAPELTALSDDPSVPPALALMATYELGREYWRRKDPRAFALLRRAFDAADSRDMFLRAGCTLWLYLRDFPDSAAPCPGLRPQLATCAPLWTPELRRECELATAKPRAAWTGKPAQWLISFYRRQISPAIGERCALTPSCSQYAQQALSRHGALGIAIYGDRAFREPDVVAAKEHPVKAGSNLKYADPVEDHDWWLKR